MKTKFHFESTARNKGNTKRMTHHELKITPEYFEEVVLGNKTFELRFNDRNYQRGDTFDLMEWNSSEFTNHSVSGEITYIFDDSKF